jgi:hypothetical protein
VAMSSINIDNFSDTYSSTLAYVKKKLSGNLFFADFDMIDEFNRINICYECLEPIYNKKHEIEIVKKTDISTQRIFLHKYHIK